MHLVSERIICPYCGKNVEIVLDLSVPEQQYVEDCFVCCRPMLIRYLAEGDEIVEVSVSAENA